MRLYSDPNSRGGGRLEPDALPQPTTPVADDNGDGDTLSSSRSSTGSRSSSSSYLPQDYRYIPGDRLGAELFPIGGGGGACPSLTGYCAGQAVWVCTSQGYKTKKKSTNNTSGNLPKTENNCTREKRDSQDSSNTVENTTASSRLSQPNRRRKLFLRATVLTDCLPPDGDDLINDSNVNNDTDDRNHRVLVQYPHGSTYRVRASLLEPILDESFMERMAANANKTKNGGENERTLLLPPPPPSSSSSTLLSMTEQQQQQQQRVVLVFAETSDYRHACVVHTGPNEFFCEVGCASGITCRRVLDHGTTPTPSSSHTNNNHRRRRLVVGVDKSPSAIAQARRLCRPDDDIVYATCDILNPEWHRQWPDVSQAPPSQSPCASSPTSTTTTTSLAGALPSQRISNNNNNKITPAVVALDINGNRDRPAVLECLQVIMNEWHPRLILVKSRSLYCSLEKSKFNTKISGLVIAGTIEAK